MSDITEAGTALAILPRTALPTLIAADDKDILASLFKELDGWEPDISTARGRNEIASKAQKVRVAKADFKRLGDRLKEDAIKTQRNVNAELKVLEERMNALVAHVRAPLDEFEAREKSRIAGHEAALAELESSGNVAEGTASSAIDAMILAFANLHVGRAWDEFEARAGRARKTTYALLRDARTTAIEREHAEEEAARLAEEEAEARRLAEIEERRIREERIAVEAAERAKAEAEEKAAREAREAEERAKTALAAAEAEAAQRQREAEERAQVELRAQALAAEQERMAGLKREREAAEALLRAERQKEEAERAAAERERVIKERERLAAEQAENQRKQAAENAERDRVAAIEDERSRVAEEAAAAKAVADKRAANRAHRAKINNDVLADLAEAINDNQGGELSVERTDDVAKAIIVAVATRKVRHTFIDYASTLGGPLL